MGNLFVADDHRFRRRTSASGSRRWGRRGCHPKTPSRAHKRTGSPLHPHHHCRFCPFRRFLFFALSVFIVILSFAFSFCIFHFPFSIFHFAFFILHFSFSFYFPASNRQVLPKHFFGEKNPQNEVKIGIWQVPLVDWVVISQILSICSSLTRATFRNFL